MGIEALRAFWEILRPLNCAMAGIAAVIGLAITSSQNLRILILIFLAVFLIAGAGNAVNDYYDRAIDAVNRPKRPIPSGRIGSQTALRYSLLLFAAGCIMAGVVNQICLGVAVLNSALLIFYARSLKATPLAGNICVAFLTGSTFLFGGGAAGVAGLLANKVPFFLSFLATMSREIMKDVEDIEGDRLGGAKTLPILAGARTASALAAAFAALAVALSFTAPWYGLHGNSGCSRSILPGLDHDYGQGRCRRIAEGAQDRNGIRPGCVPCGSAAPDGDLVIF